MSSTHRLPVCDVSTSQQTLYIRDQFVLSGACPASCILFAGSGCLWGCARLPNHTHPHPHTHTHSHSLALLAVIYSFCASFVVRFLCSWRRRPMTSGPLCGHCVYFLNGPWPLCLPLCPTPLFPCKWPNDAHVNQFAQQAHISNRIRTAKHTHTHTHTQQTHAH